jgi:hypothetical protein
MKEAPHPPFGPLAMRLPSALLPARGEKVAEGRMRGRHHPPKHSHTHPTQVARIELHTADPDIRIIWITHQEAP